MAQSVGVKRLYLSHFRIHIDSETGHENACADLQTRFAGDSGIVKDLEVFEI